VSRHRDFACSFEGSHGQEDSSCREKRDGPGFVQRCRSVTGVRKALAHDVFVAFVVVAVARELMRDPAAPPHHPRETVSIVNFLNDFSAEILFGPVEVFGVLLVLTSPIVRAARVVGGDMGAVVVEL